MHRESAVPSQAGFWLPGVLVSRYKEVEERRMFLMGMYLRRTPTGWVARVPGLGDLAVRARRAGAPVADRQVGGFRRRRFGASPDSMG